MKQKYGCRAVALAHLLTASALAPFVASQASAAPAAEAPVEVVQAPPFPPAVASATAPPSAASACTNCVLALMPVELVIDADLGSKISTTGATFPLHLSRPILIDGREVIPAGAEGQGEIIHAKKAGGSGAAGELVLAARYIMVGNRKLKLRSMRIAIAGRDAIHTVDAINAASVISPLPVGIIGFGITGRNVLVPKGSVALAKTAEAFGLEPSVVPEPAIPAAAGPDDQTRILPTQPLAAQ